MGSSRQRATKKTTGEDQKTSVDASDENGNDNGDDGEKPFISMSSEDQSQEVEGLHPTRDLYVTKPLMAGDDVSRIQELLVAKGYSNQTVTGIYTLQTATRVRKFQQQNDLPVTGEVDFATLEALNS